MKTPIELMDEYTTGDYKSNKGKFYLEVIDRYSYHFPNGIVNKIFDMEHSKRVFKSGLASAFYNDVLEIIVNGKTEHLDKYYIKESYAHPVKYYIKIDTIIPTNYVAKQIEEDVKTLGANAGLEGLLMLLVINYNYSNCGD